MYTRTLSWEIEIFKKKTVTVKTVQTSFAYVCVNVHRLNAGYTVLLKLSLIFFQMSHILFTQCHTLSRTRSWLTDTRKFCLNKLVYKFAHRYHNRNNNTI